jgi:hypothetical protein
VDVIAALALATEPAGSILSKELRRSTNMHEPIVTSEMWKIIISESIYQTTALLMLLFITPFVIDEPSRSTRHLTIFFNAFAFM